MSPKQEPSQQLVVPFLLAVLVEALVEVLYEDQQPPKSRVAWHDRDIGGMIAATGRKSIHTAGRVTWGTMTVFIALGASLKALLLSPCGWYWYLYILPPSSSRSQGMELSLMRTLLSEVTDVGFLPKYLQGDSSAFISLHSTPVRWCMVHGALGFDFVISAVGGKGREGIYHPAIRKAPDMTPRRT